MKKILGLITLFSGLAMVNVNAQDVRINIYTGYVFDDGFDSYYDASNYYEGTIEGGFQWGLGLEYMIRPTTGVELSYIRQDTKAPTKYNDGNYGIYDYAFTDFDMSLNYILLGGQRHFGKTDGKLDAFAGLMAGMVIANLEDPGNGKTRSATKFAWGIKAGANIWVTPKIALKLQGQMVSATQSMGGSFYFGTGGSGAGVSSYSSIYQWTLGGGLAFKLGK